MLEHFTDLTSLNELAAHLFQLDSIFGTSPSGEAELANWTSNPWQDRYADYTRNVYDQYIDRVQDKIVANKGLTPERAIIMDAVDRWQWYLHHPEMRTDPSTLSDAQIKQEIARLLGIRG